MLKFSFVGLALVALLSGACSNDRNADRTTSAPGEGGGATGAQRPSGSPNAIAETRLSDSAQQFLQEAVQGNQLEVDLAKLGQDRAQNDLVKDYAEQLERDHSQALDELRGLANRANVQLEREDDAQRASATNKLGNATGRQFDSQYVSLMIDDHRKDIAEFEKQQSTATGELKAFIDKTLPVLREHLQKAEDLQRQLGSTRGNR